MDITTIRIDETQARAIPTSDYGFCEHFSNHMFTERYSPDQGWHEPTVRPYAPFSMEPSSAVLHYAQMIFEGMKAYRRPDGDINLFRPWDNMRRFNDSARRMSMPAVDEELHLEAICRLVEMDANWVPQPPATLYIRPVLIGADTTLGVHASHSYLHYVITSPVGPYFKEGFAPVPVYVTDQYVRAVLGGVGEAKTGGNYAASLLAGEMARSKGYSQVLWLDGREHRWVEEVGAMNICFVYGGRTIVTPPLGGSILPGVTRMSVIELGRDLGYEVSESMVDVNEMLADVKSGKITEVFGCGTAAVIAPVGKLGWHDESVIVNNNQPGEVARRLFQELTDIQFGRVPDRFGWTHTIHVNGK